MTPIPLLLIDDDPLVGRLLVALFEPRFEVHHARTGADGLGRLSSSQPAVIVLDLGLPDTGGLNVLQQIQLASSQIPVIMLTGSSDLKMAIKAMQLGAFHYLTKPVDNEEFQVVVDRALERSSLLNEVRDLREHRNPVALLVEQMGPSEQIAGVVRRVGEVASSELTVLILGETGTGKEVVAQAIHRQSHRRGRPLIALDCGAIPETLMESELFGHEKGAFTGADRKRTGQFQLAEGGTLFLDEVGNLGPALQAKLLRVLESRQVTPVGGGKAQVIDVRFIAATNADLPSRVREGKFREDLYFRLAQYTLALPALRERPNDIEHLCGRFLSEAALEMRKPVTGLAPSAIDALRRHDWPGNVRELRNVMRLAVLQCTGFQIEAATILPILAGVNAGAPVPAPELPAGASLRQVADAAVQAAETRAIESALQECGGNKAAAARRLRTDYKTLHLKLRRYGISAS